MTNLSFSIVKIEKCYTSNCKYFARQIHWCTQNNVWTSSLGPGTSSMYHKGFIKNFPGQLLSWHIYISVVYQIVCIYQAKSNGDIDLSQDCHPHWIRKTPDHPPSGTFLIHKSFPLHIIVIYLIVCIFLSHWFCKILDNKII